MDSDRSGGWDAAADRFMATRSRIGVGVVRRWARRLPQGAAIVDIGCGSGDPVAATLIEEGLEVFGVDASPRLVEAFRQRFPGSQVACEAAEDSVLFGRRFDGAVAIGLLFLLPAESQRTVITRVAAALEPGGRFLFSAPHQLCEWDDVLTGRRLRSLGIDEYRRVLEASAMHLSDSSIDEGDNHYFDAVRSAE